MQDPPMPIGNGRLTVEQGIEISPEQEELILDYINAHFISLANLELKYPSQLFASDAAIQSLGNQIIWEIVIEIRKMQEIDLHLDSYSYELVCNRITPQKNGDVTIYLKESNIQNFAAYPDVNSESWNISHTFLLTPTAAGWRIKEHSNSGRLFHFVMDGYLHYDNSEPVDAEIGLLEMKKAIIADAQQNVQQQILQKSASVTAPLSRDHDYDREAAVAYASAWASQRNPDWPEYDEDGGNCNNFISQCLLAGGIPMDYSGANQWKWYGELPNTTSKPRGRSPSWAGVNEFYDYVRANQGYWMVAQPDANYSTGEIGDILQLGFLEDWGHSVIITEVVKDDTGATVDFLIASNTADQWNFPVSAYNYTMLRVIKIYGWNDVR